MHVIREINRGGFGRVEEVRLHDGSEAAKKTFAPSFHIASAEERDKLVKRFQREARVQSKLSSEAFIPLIGDGLDSAEPYYLMPLAERNLAEEIRAHKGLGSVPDTALWDVLNALDELHELGYVHRDLKPANVLFWKGAWRLSDFGLVLPPGDSTTKLTAVDSNWGTIDYCAPEQVHAFRHATPAVDIYAFGCILHDIYGVTPRTPYARCSAPGDIGAVIEKCTEPRPDRRFQSIQALRSALYEALADGAKTVLSPSATNMVSEVNNAPQWELPAFQGLVRFMEPAKDEERSAILRGLTDEAFARAATLDADVFKTLATIFCDWVEATSFDWDFCDVLAKRLERIFELGDIEVKAMAVMAAAELGRYHNRWFVMGRVLQMAGPQLQDVVARRLAIEIKASAAEARFKGCAEVLGRKLGDYHPRIAALLEESKQSTP